MLIDERLNINKGIADDYIRLLDIKFYELVERMKSLGWTQESEEVLRKLDEESKQITIRERAKKQ